MSGDMTLRERKKRQNREALAEAALQLFRERGFDAVTVDEVADAAGVSRSTFFRTFATKEAVVFARHPRRIRRFRRSLAEPRSDEAPFRTVRRACLAIAKEAAARREALLAQHAVVAASPALVAAERELDRDWEGAIADALGARGVDELRAQVVAGAAIGALRATFCDWIEGEGREDFVTMAEQTLALLEERLATSAPPR